MSRRELIRMSDEERRTFLAEHRSATVATIGRDGIPHLVAMWYGLINGEIVMWTYAKSQKVRNLRRWPAISCLVESGERYEELRGVSISGTGVISDDADYVQRVGRVVLFPAGSAEGAHGLDPASREILMRTGAKRVAVTVKATRIATWDHRKLGGRY